jgi:hypothetical protein
MKEVAMKRLLFTAMLIALAAAVSGCSIDFDDVDGTGNPVLTSLTTEGFTFTSGHFHAIGEPGICSFGGCVDNGTVYIQEEAGTLGLPITMVSADGGTFSLFGFEGAQAFLDDAAAALGKFPNATAVFVQGTFSGGGQTIQSFDLDDVGFKEFTVVMTELVSVTFVGSTDDSDPGAFALDNIFIIPDFTAEQAPASLETSVELAPSEVGDPVAAE